MKKIEEWIKELESEVESKFDKTMVDGFEDSAPSIKLAILCDMYEEEPMDNEPTKERAYARLAEQYEAQAAWN